MKHAYHRMPSPDTCVLRDVLERRARETPDRCFVTFADGASWTFAELLAQTRRAAAGMQQHGVVQDDRVLLWMPNGADALRFGLPSTTWVRCLCPSIPTTAGACSGT